jgi:hypothetical protein
MPCGIDSTQTFHQIEHASSPISELLALPVGIEKLCFEFAGKSMTIG